MLDAWLDNDGLLWLTWPGQSPQRCRDLDKVTLVSLCADLDLLPEKVQSSVTQRAMQQTVQRYYDLTIAESQELYQDDDLLEFYWEWAVTPRRIICRTLYDYFCGQNVISPHCAVDRELARR